MQVPPRLGVLSHPLLVDVPYRPIIGAGCAVLTLVVWAFSRIISWASGADAEYAAELEAAKAELELSSGGAPTLVSKPVASSSSAAAGGRGRKGSVAGAAAFLTSPPAVSIPTEAELLSSPGVTSFDAELAGTMAEGVHADSLVRAAIAAEKARAAVAATGVSLKCVRTGVATTPLGPLALVPSPTAVTGARPAAASAKKASAAASASAAPEASSSSAPLSAAKAAAAGSKASRAASSKAAASSTSIESSAEAGGSVRRQRSSSFARSTSVGARKRR